MIYKYPLVPRLITEITVPEKCKFLSAGNQRGLLQVWALVDPESPMVARYLYAAGTGHPWPAQAGDPSQAKFISTVLDDIFVWHVFELPYLEKLN